MTSEPPSTSNATVAELSARVNALVDDNQVLLERLDRLERLLDSVTSPVNRGLQDAGDPPVVLYGPSHQPVNLFSAAAARRAEIADGSKERPVTTTGPLVRISKVEALTAAELGGNPGNDEQHVALLVSNYALPASDVQCVAAHFQAISENPHRADATHNPDVVGVNCIGVVRGSGIGGGTGGYFEGQRRDGSAGHASGMEVRVGNHVDRSEGYDPNVYPATNGLWITTSSDFGRDSVSAINIAGIDRSWWKVGIAGRPGSVREYLIRDDSSCQATLRILGRHDYGVDMRSAGFNVAELRLRDGSTLRTSNNRLIWKRADGTDFVVAP